MSKDDDDDETSGVSYVPVLSRDPAAEPLPPEVLLVSKILVVGYDGRDHVHFWNRGGRAGKLVLAMGDGATLARCLGCVRVEEASDVRP